MSLTPEVQLLRDSIEALRVDVREGFARLDERLASQGSRINTLEQNDARRSGESRVFLGFLTGASSIAGGIITAVARRWF